MTDRNKTLDADIRNGCQVFGSLPNINYASFRESSSAEKLKGYVAENVIGNMLNLLTYEHPDMYVTHRVILHDAEVDGETDHIIIHQNTIILLETKASALLKVTSTPNQVTSVKINGREGRYNNTNHLVAKVEKYQKRFPEFTVIGALIFTDARTKTLNMPGNPVHVLTTKQLHSFFQQIFERTEPVDKETTIRTVTYFAQNTL